MVRTQVGIYTIVITLFVAVVYILERAVKNDSPKRICYWGMIAVYSSAVLWLTLFSRRPQGERIMFLVPFGSYPLAHQGYLDNVAAAAKDDIITILERIRSFLYSYNWLVLNAFLFIPYGVLTPGVFLKAKKTKLLFYGILGSAIIELVQYIFKLGCFDIDDVIQNTIGICIGLLLSILLRSDSVKYGQSVGQSGEQKDG